MASDLSRRDFLTLLTVAGAGALMTGGPAVAFVDPYVWPKYKSHVHFYTRGAYRYVNTNDIPAHKVGRFPDRGCPNAIKPQAFHFRMPLHPHSQNHLRPLENYIVFGVALDGVVFDPGTAMFWHHQRGSQWNLVLMTGYANLGLDQSHAHVQFNGTYHYHGLPTEMIELAHGWGKVCLVGYAADGFPIYGPWGYRDPHNARSGVKKLAPSYRLRVGRRPGPPHGPGGHYDGKYTGDFEYVPGGGDLDKANGRYGVTPEYPGGTYYYVITATYPFIPRYFRGTPDRSFYKHLPRGGRRTGGGRGGFRPGGGGGGGPGGFGPGGFGGGPPQ